jgi:hypothetical protein
VVVKEGAPKPDVSTVEAFKRALLAAKSVAYIDPASGGSSGIYIDKLLDRLGIADQIRPKAKLKKGGHVADLIVSGAASNRDALPEFILFGDSLPITVFTSTAKRLNRPQGRDGGDGEVRDTHQGAGRESPGSGRSG